MDQHSPTLSTEAQPSLADCCEWLPDGGRRPCYALASLVLARPNGEDLRFSCAEHRDAWASRIRGRYWCSSGTSGRRGAADTAGRSWEGKSA
jgi:hypothetical protein